MAHALRRNDGIDPLWDHLVQARLHLATFCFQTAPNGHGLVLSFANRVATAAAFHPVVVFDQPSLVKAHPEGFNDGVGVFLPSRFGLNLLLDHEPHETPALQRWLHKHLEDIVAQSTGGERSSSLHRVERATLQRWMGAHAIVQPALGFNLDSAVAPVLERLYKKTSLDVRGALSDGGVDALSVLDHTLEHGAWDHPLVSLSHVAQNNLLAQQVGQRIAHSHDDAVEAAQAWATHFNGCEPFLQNIMAGQASNVVRAAGLESGAMEVFMKAASDHHSFSMAGRRALIHNMASYSGVAPVQHSASMAQEMVVDQDTLWATPDQALPRTAQRPRPHFG